MQLTAVQRKPASVRVAFNVVSGCVIVVSFTFTAVTITKCHNNN